MRGGYVVRRLGVAMATILAIVLFNFVLFRLMPGSPERILFRGIPNVSEERLDAARARWGLDDPILPIVIDDAGIRFEAENQFFKYLVATAQGDLGFSFVARGQEVANVLAQRLWPTLLLFGLGEAIAIVVGLVLGAYSGWRRGGLVDFFGNGASLFLYATPYFLLGMVLVLLGAAVGLPTFGMLTAGASYPDVWARLTDLFAHLLLPVATVALGLIGQYAIVMRSSIVETISEDYVTTARAMGLREGRILGAHAVPNALLPTVSLIAINLGYVIAGAVTVEVVFNWPGLGTLTVEALGSRDYPVLQGVFLLLSITVVLANLLADLVYGLLDPRVRT
ncbi:MAG TPA: ABC transporter permease [Candidatus Limnocylindrales bacterium]|nr:ABC transporter permease [Candidatus Limnocylindrales bacterium]